MKKNLITIIAVAIVLMAAVTPFKWKQISDVIPTKEEINFVDGVTSNIQTQLNAKVNESDSLTATDYFYTESEVDAIALLKADKSAAGITILKDNTQHSVVNTIVTTTVYTGIIPANTLSSGGKLIFENLLSFIASTNSKTIRVQINGSTVGYFSTAAGTSVSAQNTYRLWLRSGNAQICQNVASNSSNGFTVGTLAPTTTSFDYSTDWTVTVTISMASASETASLEAFNVVYFP